MKTVLRIFLLSLILISCGDREERKTEPTVKEKVKGYWSGYASGCEFQYNFAETTFTESIQCSYYGSQFSKGTYQISGSSLIMYYDQTTCPRQTTQVNAMINLTDNSMVISNSYKTLLLYKKEAQPLNVSSNTTACVNYFDQTKSTTTTVTTNPIVYAPNPTTTLPQYPTTTIPNTTPIYNYPTYQSGYNTNGSYNTNYNQSYNYNTNYYRLAAEFNSCIKRHYSCHCCHNSCRDRDSYTRVYQSCYAKIYGSHR